MTEQLWHVRTDPNALLNFIRDRASRRKLRLFACACSRRVLHLVGRRITLKAIEFAEKYADGLRSVKELHDNAWGRGSDLHGVVLWEDWDSASLSSEHASGLVADRMAQTDRVNHAFWSAAFERALQENLAISEAISRADNSVPNGFVEMRENARFTEQKMQTDLLRDIFGNPFRPVTLDPRWLTSTVLDLARSIYDEFPRQVGGSAKMPILADALMDAGCDSEEIISHCRAPGPHVRGCYVVDLILGKE